MGLDPAPEQLALSVTGRRVVRPGTRPGTLFVVSGVTPDQLSEKAGNARYLSTPDLLRRVRNPSPPRPTVDAVWPERIRAAVDGRVAELRARQRSR